MHVVSILHLLGLLLIFLAASMLLPLPFSFYYGDDDYLALLSSASVTFASGFALFKLTRLKQALRAKEGFAVVTFGWIIFSAFGALPFVFSGAIPSYG